MHGVFRLIGQLLAFEAQPVTVHLELHVGPCEGPQQALTVKKEPALAPVGEMTVTE